MIWKIYKHTLMIDCPSKGKSYIGQTSKKDISERWQNGYGYYSIRPRRNETVFWKAIKKYGWNSFTHEIIEDNIPTLELANEREKYWIAYYHTYIEDNNCWGYNMTLGGSGVSHKQSEVTKQKISNALTGRSFSESHKAKLKELAKKTSKAIICVETNIKYNSISEASAQTGISRENIRESLKGTRSSAGGYHWALADDANRIAELKKLNGKHKLAKAKIRCIELDLVFDSIADAGRFINKTPTTISAVLGNKHKTAGKYHWEYLEVH